MLSVVLGVTAINARKLLCIRHAPYVQAGYLASIKQLVDNFNAHEKHAYKILVMGHRLPDESVDLARRRAIEAGNLLLACGVQKDAIEIKSSADDEGNFVDLSIMADFFFTTH